MNPQAHTVAELQYPRLVETAVQVLSAWEETKVAPELWKPGEILTLQMLRVKLVRKGLFNALQEALAREQAAIQGLIEYFRGINQPEVIQAADDETDEMADRLLRDLSLAGTQPRHTDVAAEILGEAKEALHFAEIESRMRARGHRVGGKEPARTLRVYLQRDPRFVRVEKPRGVYKLKDTT